MNKMLLLLGTMACVSGLVHAQSDCQSADGTTHCRDMDQQRLVQNGQVFLNHVRILGELVVNGQLVAKQCEIGRLILNGNGRLDRVAVAHPDAIRGDLNADQSHFESMLEVWGNHLTLSGVQSQGITMHAGESQMPIVKLTSHTVVHGPIRFENHHGLVQIDKTIDVVPEVIGGRVEILA